MLPIDQTAYEAIRPELLSGEAVLWAGRPERRVIFHQEDAFLIPFSLLWGGFAIFWEGGVLGLFGFGHGNQAPGFFVLWGVPFVLIGQYLIWGRFFMAAWKKAGTYYAVTDRRVLVVQNAWKYKTASSYIDALPVLTLESGSGSLGTLRFGPRPDVFARNNSFGVWDGMNIDDIPVFRDIECVREVYQLVGELREKARKTSLVL